MLLSCGLAYGHGIDPDILKSQAGTYLVAPEDGASGCRLTLETGEAIGGYSVSGQASFDLSKLPSARMSKTSDEPSRLISV
ncbi:hypothetical protein ACC702_39535, partial [Rhizobium ruizarguesonis]